MILRATYRDGVLVPRGGHILRDGLDEGEAVTVTVERDRNMGSHRHQFAFVREAWLNLPEHLSDAPYAANPEALRKHALICTGFCDLHTVITTDPEKLAALLRKEGTRAHGYCLTKIEGEVVMHYTPHSQSVPAMGSEQFKQSKAKIMDWLAALLDVEPHELRGAS